MPHIHTEPGQKDSTVTAYIVRTDGAQPRALMHMHRKLGRLMPVGGHIELHETPWQSIAHELPEESGYGLDELQILQPPHRITFMPRVTLHPYPVVMNTHDVPGTGHDHYHTDTAYAFAAAGPPREAVGAGESQDLRWLTRQEVQSLGEDEVFMNSKIVYDFIFKVCLKEWEAVATDSFEL